jgi:hypothetical protein
LTDDEIATRYTKSDERGRYALTDLTVPAIRPSLDFEWRGVKPLDGRAWRFGLETLDQLEQDGRIHHVRRNSLPRLKSYLNESAGVEVDTVWKDIPLLSPASRENTRYPTQKPVSVLERLIEMGSNQGEVVLDPFCGSGTTIVAAERHQRRWIACDTSQEAIELATKRLIQEFGQAHPTSFTLGDTESISSIPVQSTGHARVAVRLWDLRGVEPVRFVLNQQVSIEETRHYEFKEVRSGGGAVDSIVNAADEYAVAYLNSQGGRVYWGIRDRDRTVVGVRLNYHERDKVRRDVSSKLNQIEPRLDPSQYRIEFHGVLDEQGLPVSDICVVELVVPASDSADPYYTGGGVAWVKVDGAKRKLTGPALTEFIKRRLVAK